MTTHPEIELILPPDVKPEPAFSTPEEYEKFVAAYSREVSPALKEYEIKRRKSEEAARLKWV